MNIEGIFRCGCAQGGNIVVDEIWILQKSVAVTTDHLHQLLFLFLILVPPVDAVARGGTVKLPQHDLVVLDNLCHILDPHSPIQGIVTVQPVGSQLRCGGHGIKSLKLWVPVFAVDQHPLVQPRGLQIDLKHLLKQQTILILNLILLL